MEENQKPKFVCKFCNKTYPCGKSLGGHIRTHMTESSAQRAAEEERSGALSVKLLQSGKKSKTDSVSVLESAGDGNSGYGLREKLPKPKRAERFPDASFSFHEENVCKECGKGFQSLKALCGHMACHSVKEKEVKKLDDHEEIRRQQLVTDSQSDTETSASRGLRRSKRLKHKSSEVHSPLPLDCSSSSSKIEQEQKEVAISLMMLSRDSGCTERLHSFTESSENNSESAVFEAKSFSTDRRTAKGNLDFAYESLGKNKTREGKLKAADFGVSGHSESGFLRSGLKKVESGYYANGSRENFEQSLKSRAGVHGNGTNPESGFGNLKRKAEELEKWKRNEITCDRFHVDSSSKLHSDISFCRETRKGSKYECLNGRKIFHSNDIVGGQKASQKKINDSCDSLNESCENSAETKIYPISYADGEPVESFSSKNLADHRGERKPVSKKSRGHQCPICLKVFRSGQALGGHKRSHFVGGSGDITMVMKPETPEVKGLIDLNLPAPMEEEGENGHVEFIAW